MITIEVSPEAAQANLEIINAFVKGVGVQAFDDNLRIKELILAISKGVQKETDAKKAGEAAAKKVRSKKDPAVV